jgi:hypothetical protein
MLDQKVSVTNLVLDSCIHKFQSMAANILTELFLNLRSQQDNIYIAGYVECVQARIRRGMKEQNKSSVTEN